jgi:DNA polymerase-3 subunit epsilon
MGQDGTPLRQFCLPPGWDPPDGDCMPGHPPTGRCPTRQHARGHKQRQFGYLARLAAEVDRLPVVSWDERCETYVALLDRCLEDHLITDEERDALRDLARMLGMTGDDVRAAHRAFVDRIVAAAWADGVVTDAEARDLRAVGHWLGIDPAGIDTLIASANVDQEPEVRPRTRAQSVWTGTTVCFTGTLPNGMTRAQAWEVAEAAGCIPAKTVTKKVDVLVVADPNTKSGKANKAREYGTRIMAADRFFREVGIHELQFTS